MTGAGESTSAFCPRCRSQWSISTSATIASAIGGRPQAHAGVVPAGGDHLRRLAGAVHAAPGESKARRRLEGDAGDDILPGRDSAQDPPRVVAQEPGGHDLVAVLGALLLHRREPGAELDSLDRIDSHQRRRKLGVELRVHRLAEPAWNPACTHRDPGADGIPFLAQGIHEALELGYEIGVGREERVVVHLVQVHPGGLQGPELGEPPPYRATEPRTEVLLRNCPRRDPERGLASRGPASAAVVANAVLGKIRVVGVGGAEDVPNRAVVPRPCVDVLDEERDRGPRAHAFEHPGQDPDLIRLAALRRMPALARPTAVELGLDVGFGEGEPGRTPVHHAADGGTVALPERRHREMLAEGVTGHGGPVPPAETHRHRPAASRAR